MEIIKCEHCDEICEDENELEIMHRGCRMKAAFPGAYSEELNGIVTFDVNKITQALGLFDDWVIDRDGKQVHPLDGDLKFRIGESGIWIEVPVQVGNQLSSWSFLLSEDNWRNIVRTVDAGLEAVHKHRDSK